VLHVFYRLLIFPSIPVLVPIDELEEYFLLVLSTSYCFFANWFLLFTLLYDALKRVDVFDSLTATGVLFEINVDLGNRCGEMGDDDLTDLNERLLSIVRMRCDWSSKKLTIFLKSDFVVTIIGSFFTALNIEFD
jgi:hypothetical protein